MSSVEDRCRLMPALQTSVIPVIKQGLPIEHSENIKEVNISILPSAMHGPILRQSGKKSPPSSPSTISCSSSPLQSPCPISGDLPSSILTTTKSPSLGFELSSNEHSPQSARHSPSFAIPITTQSELNQQHIVIPNHYHNLIDNKNLLELSSFTRVPSEGTISETDVPVCQWESCGAKLETLQELVTHLQQQHTQTLHKYVCLWKGCLREKKPFDARYKLVTHLRCHTGERPYECLHAGCSRKFSRLENLKLHMRTHTGEKPYTCHHEGCGKRFNNTSDRAKHMKTHITSKPYICKHPGCGKAYTDPSSMRKHIKFAHQNHQRPNHRNASVNVTNTSSDPVQNISDPTPHYAFVKSDSLLNTDLKIKTTAATPTDRGFTSLVTASSYLQRPTIPQALSLAAAQSTIQLPSTPSNQQSMYVMMPVIQGLATGQTGSTSMLIAPTTQQPTPSSVNSAGQIVRPSEQVHVSQAALRAISTSSSMESVGHISSYPGTQVVMIQPSPSLGTTFLPQTFASQTQFVSLVSPTGINQFVPVNQSIIPSATQQYVLPIQQPPEPMRTVPSSNPLLYQQVMFARQVQPVMLPVMPVSQVSTSTT